jgi:hypothetical protein
MNKREKKRIRRAMDDPRCRCEVRQYSPAEIVRVEQTEHPVYGMLTGYLTNERWSYTIYRCATCGKEYTDAPAMAAVGEG